MCTSSSYLFISFANKINFFLIKLWDITLIFLLVSSVPYYQVVSLFTILAVFTIIHHHLLSLTIVSHASSASYRCTPIGFHT